MKIKYKKVKQLTPFCGSCGERLMGDNSLFSPYNCREGIWRANIDNPTEYILINGVFENIDIEMMCENSDNPELTFYKIVRNHLRVTVWPNYAEKWIHKWATIGYSQSIKEKYSAERKEKAKREI